MTKGEKETERFVTDPVDQAVLEVERLTRELRQARVHERRMRAARAAQLLPRYSESPFPDKG